MSEGAYALVGVRVPRRVRLVVLVLHGGAAPGYGVRAPTRRTQLSVLRLVPVAWWIAWTTRRSGVAVFRQRNTWRGWDTDRSPVDDTLASLDALTEQVGPRPVVLVGHSLGGRTALLAGEDERVRAVAALNAYVYDSDTPRLEGRRVLLVHGDDDRVADPAKVRVLAARLTGAQVSEQTVAGGNHGMTRHVGSFDGAAALFVRSLARGLRD